MAPQSTATLRRPKPSQTLPLMLFAVSLVSHLMTSHYSSFVGVDGTRFVPNRVQSSEASKGSCKAMSIRVVLGLLMSGVSSTKYVDKKSFIPEKLLRLYHE